MAEALPLIPNFAEGSQHTPTAPVEVLGEEGMLIETIRAGSRLAGEPELVTRAAVVYALPCDLYPHNPELWTRMHFGFACNVATAEVMYADIRLPVGTEITSISARLRGNPHSVWPPAVMPQISANRWTMSAPTFSENIGDSMFYSGTQSEYEGAVGTSLGVANIGASANRIITDPAQNVRLSLISEGGENAISGMQVYGFIVGVLVNRMQVP